MPFSQLQPDHHAANFSRRRDGNSIATEAPTTSSAPSGEISQNSPTLRSLWLEALALQGFALLLDNYPVTKSQRISDSSGNLTSTIVDLDPWGGETGRSSNQAFQPHRFTSYERDANGGDDAMMRRYQSSSSRFNQPDPYDGSYNFADPQSFNRYAYVNNDPVNFVDPSGLTAEGPSGYVEIRISFDDPTSTAMYLRYLLFRPENTGGVTGGDTGGTGPGGNDTPQNPTPQGPAPGQKLSESDCEKRLAALFGGPGARASTQREPNLIDPDRAGSLRFPEHSATGGVVHLYSNEQGTAPPNSVGLYVPRGFSAVPGGRGTEYYPDVPGQVNRGQVNYNYAQYQNSAGVMISFIHIGPRVGDRRNAARSNLVGSIAGPGGDGYGYNHTHINFYLKGKRVDPRSIFCK